MESRQNVIKELYEKFFQRAFPKVADRLGIVYTPTEIIDFMLKSVNQALSDEFNTKMGAKNVHILDPFTGTGTFLVKLLSLLDKRDIQRTYNEFLHVCPDGAVRRGVDRGRPGLARRLMYELNEVRMRNPRPSVASIGFRDRVRAPRNAQVVDLFCGCGGMSLGFLANGYRLAGGADLNETAVRTYAENLAPAFVRDVRDLVGDESELKSFLAGLPDFDPAAPTVLVGGPPCQGFTAHRKRSWDVPDPRNDLVSVFARAAVLMLPDAVAMENVPELLSARYRPYFDSFRSVLEAAGYVVRAGIVNAATFGVPQERFRAVVVAMRSGRFGLPSPRLTPERFATVRDAIGDLPPVEAGVAHPSDPMHRSAAHRASTIATLRAVPRDGGSRPPGTGPACLDRVAGYYDVYGRLAWGRPSITITHYARNPASGRFAHPEQDRGLTMRETARLQGFPDWFRFSGSFDQVFGQIGEAVPPPLARGIAEAVSAGLAGRVLRGAAEEALEPVSDSYGGVIAAQKMRRAGRSAGV